MRRIFPLGLAALAVVATGCGGASKERVQPSVQQNSGDCDFRQITAGARREGACVARGVSVTVANRAHWLHGKDYDARVLGVRFANAMTTAAGRLLRPHGRFVIVTLAVRNTLAAPHEFDRASDLVFLLVDGKYFGESPEAESVRRLGSFRLRGADLPPDEVAAGTVVFDIPAEHSRHLSSRGSNLIFVDFGDEAKGFPTGTQPLQTLGYIRLWK
jgi:hypothetical protein